MTTPEGNPKPQPTPEQLEMERLKYNQLTMENQLEENRYRKMLTQKEMQSERLIAWCVIAFFVAVAAILIILTVTVQHTKSIEARHPVPQVTVNCHGTAPTNPDWTCDFHQGGERGQ